ncbi:hypothetical protein STEG23_001945, partial [Scotinomys teguina]
HFAAPDENYEHLYQESLSETQVQVERGTTSDDARLSKIPFAYQKKNLSVDNLVPEKKPLIITRNVSPNKKYFPPRDDNAENENVNGVFTDEDLESDSEDSSDMKDEYVNGLSTDEDLESECMDPKILEAQNKSVTEFQQISKRQKILNPIVNNLIFHLDMDNVIENDLNHLKNIFERHLLSKFTIGLKSGLDKGLSIVKGSKLLEKLKEQHDMSLFMKKDTGPDVSLLKTKLQENFNTKYQSLKKFPTKVINLSLLASQEENMESSSPYMDETPTPFYRTHRGSSGIPTTLQKLPDRKTAGDLKPKTGHKKKTEVASQLRISITSPKTYVQKGQSKHQKLRKKSAEPQNNLHLPIPSIKKQTLQEEPRPVKLVEKGLELPNNLKIPTFTPKINIIKELSKTSHVDGEDVQLSEFATKEPEIGEQPKLINLNDKDAIILYNLHDLTSDTNKDLTKELSKVTHFYGDDAQHSSIVPMSTFATRKPETEETSKTTNLDKKDVEVADDEQMLNLAATVNALRDPSKPRTLDKKAVEDILHMSSSALIQYFLRESSKTSDVGKEAGKGSNTLHKSTSSVKKHVHKELSKTKNLGKNVVEGTPSRHILTDAKKKLVLK